MSEGARGADLGVAGGPPPARPRGEFHIPSLDGIRAISFLIVFVAHGGFYDTVPGGFGVTVFFFLSGYLITTLMRLELQGTGRISFRDFYLRRVLRILPPFYVVLALAVGLALAGLLPGDMTWKPVVAILAHVTNYWHIYEGAYGFPTGTGVYWSLAVEEHFYFVFPMIFVLLQRVIPGQGRAQGWVLLGLCGLVLLWRMVLVFALQATTDRTYLASDTRIDSILFGCAMAVGFNPMLDQPRRSLGLWRNWLFPLGLGVLMFTFVYRASWFRETIRYTLQGVALIPVFVVAMRAPDWGPFKLLNNKLVRHVGVLSYSLYLVHQVILALLEKQLHGQPELLRSVIALAISLALAQAINRLIEKPCARLRRKYAHAGWLSARPADAAAARSS